MARKVLELTNLERKQKELPPMEANALLNKVAQAHSENMAKQGKLDHKLDDMTPLKRLRAAGYTQGRAYENIAQGDAGVSVEKIMTGWMESKGHRENILNTVCTEIGVGIAMGENGQVYYTQLFGQPK